MSDIDFNAVEAFANGSCDHERAIDIERQDDGSLLLMYGGGTPVADVAWALVQLPQDARLIDTRVMYFAPDDDMCEGQPDPDEGHTYPVIEQLFAVDHCCIHSKEDS